MKWIKVITGIAPESSDILVLREDNSLVLATKGDADNVFGFRYFDQGGNDIMKGPKPVYFMNIRFPSDDLPEMR